MASGNSISTPGIRPRACLSWKKPAARSAASTDLRLNSTAARRWHPTVWCMTRFCTNSRRSLRDEDSFRCLNPANTSDNETTRQKERDESEGSMAVRVRVASLHLGWLRRDLDPGPGRG